jgi:hypothetical protein
LIYSLSQFSKGTTPGFSLQVNVGANNEWGWHADGWLLRVTSIEFRTAEY